MISLQKIVSLLGNSNKGYTCYMIDEEGLDHIIDQYQAIFRIAEGKHTIKIEDLEKDIPEFKKTRVHCFVSPRGSKSFGLHSDPMDVTIYCIYGIKTMCVDGKDVSINEGESLFIPANTSHDATNKHESVILSVGD
jgi:glyoxylate utilization-related uncharacterized protein